jgi:hypothetical protein
VVEKVGAQAAEHAALIIGGGIQELKILFGEKAQTLGKKGVGNHFED